MSIEIESEKINEEVFCIKIKGRLNSSNAKELRNFYKKKIDGKVDCLLNLYDLDFMDSTGLGTIISFLKSQSENNKKLYLVGMRPKVRMVFEITRAHKIFEIFDDADAATKKIMRDKKHNISA